MEPIKLYLFGQARLAYGTAERVLPLSRVSRALLAFLIMQRRAVPREAVIDAIWQEVDDVRGRNALNTALWRLRQIVRDNLPSDALHACISGGEVRLEPSEIWWIDVPQFERAVSAGLSPHNIVPSPDAVAAFRQALALYVGDFLEGYYYNWVQTERERLRSLYLAGLEELMRYLAVRGEITAAIAIGERILQLDPLREEVHRFIIWLYAQSSQRDKAIQQYIKCRDILQAELGILPSEETRDLYERARQPEMLRQFRAIPGRPQTLKSARDASFGEAMAALREANDKLQLAFRLFKSLTDGDYEA